MLNKSPNPNSNLDFNALDVDKISIAYGQQLALDKVSLKVKRGTLTALIGPNGAGKSSLVKAICGRINIQEGSITINGLNASSRGARKTLGVAPQRVALYNHLTAQENLICFGQQAGLSRRDSLKNSQDVLATIGMADKAHIRVGKMSGGMRQRINIGAAIVHRPSLIILDEPASSLDPAGIEQINRLIQQLKNDQYAILLITHHMEQASALADMITIFKNGKLSASGNLQTLIAQYCGTNAVITIAAKNNANTHTNITNHGYAIDPNNPYQWSKSITDKNDLIKEYKQLKQAKIDFSSFSLSTPDLNTILRMIIKDEAIDSENHKEICS